MDLILDIATIAIGHDSVKNRFPQTKILIRHFNNPFHQYFRYVNNMTQRKSHTKIL